MRFLRSVQRRDFFDFAHIDSAYAQPIIAEHNLKNVDSVIVIQEGGVHVKSDAVLKIIARLHWPYRWLYILVVIPRFIRDWMYDILARNRRKWFGRSKDLTCDFLVEGGDSQKDIPKQT